MYNQALELCCPALLLTLFLPQFPPVLAGHLWSPVRVNVSMTLGFFP